MKYKNTLLAVADMERSKRFYREVLGLRVVADFGANVTLSGGLALQTLESWRDFIGKEEICFFNNAAEVYFEEDDFDAFAERLAAFGVNYVHPVLEQLGAARGALLRSRRTYRGSGREHGCGMRTFRRAGAFRAADRSAHGRSRRLRKANDKKIKS